MKKLISLFLAVAMILSLASVAMAEGDNENDVYATITKGTPDLSNVSPVAGFTFEWSVTENPEYELSAPTDIVWDPENMMYTSKNGRTMTAKSAANVSVTVKNRGNIAYTAASAFAFESGFTGLVPGIDSGSYTLESAANGVTDINIMGTEQSVSFSGQVSLESIPASFNSFGSSVKIGTCTITLTPIAAD